MEGFFVTGTDTDVGKTVVAAWLLAQLDCAHLDACYWKPVQAGTVPETDSATVRRLSGVDGARILPEAYVLPEAIAPHEAARRAGIAIDMAREYRHPGEPEDDVAEHGSSPLCGWSDATALVAELEPRRYRVVPMVPASHGGPPCGAEGEHQAGRRDEASQDCRRAWPCLPLDEPR